MGLTVLEICQSVCREISFVPPTALVTSTEETGKQIKSIAEETARELSLDFQWPELIREYTFSLVSGTAGYALPGDFSRWVQDTQWNRTKDVQLSGPESAQDYQANKASGLTSAITQNFRVRGDGPTSFLLDPTPSSSYNGNTIAFEYFSTSCFRPKTWTASQTFLASSYCFYDGRIYQTTLGGVTGATAPTHLTGSASDGGVTWTYYNSGYRSILADTDECRVDEDAFKKGVKWRFSKAKGIDFELDRTEYYELIQKRGPAKRGAPVISMCGGSRRRYPNIPESGFGGV